METKITKNCITIEDSYKVSDKTTMKEILESLKSDHSECEVFNIRTINSLIIEWRAHNLLYNLGLFKSHTKDVDLDCGETWYRLMVYYILSIFY